LTIVYYTQDYVFHLEADSYLADQNVCPRFLWQLMERHILTLALLSTQFRAIRIIFHVDASPVRRLY